MSAWPANGFGAAEPAVSADSPLRQVEAGLQPCEQRGASVPRLLVSLNPDGGGEGTSAYRQSVSRLPMSAAGLWNERKGIAPTSTTTCARSCMAATSAETLRSTTAVKDHAGVMRRRKALPPPAGSRLRVCLCVS
jgi:hypothetical protein